MNGRNMSSVIFMMKQGVLKSAEYPLKMCAKELKHSFLKIHARLLSRQHRKDMTKVIGHGCTLPTKVKAECVLNVTLIPWMGKCQPIFGLILKWAIQMRRKTA